MSYASSNDVAVPTKAFNEIRSAIQSNKRVCYSNYFQTDAKLKNKRVIKFPVYNYKRHLKGNFVTDCATIQTALLREFTPFRVKYGNFAYWDLWLRIYEGKGSVFSHFSGATFNYRVTPKSRHLTIKKNKATGQKRNRQKALMLSHHRK